MPVATEPLLSIRPISDLRVRLNDVCAQATETQEPIVLTKNGTAAYVLMDSAAYDEQKRQMRYYLALREAEIEEKYATGPISAEESDSRMRAIFETWGLDYA